MPNDIAGGFRAFYSLFCCGVFLHLGGSIIANGFRTFYSILCNFICLLFLNSRISLYCWVNQFYEPRFLVKEKSFESAAPSFPAAPAPN